MGHDDWIPFTPQSWASFRPEVKSSGKTRPCSPAFPNHHTPLKAPTARAVETGLWTKTSVNQRETCSWHDWKQKQMRHFYVAARFSTWLFQFNNGKHLVLLRSKLNSLSLCFSFLCIAQLLLGRRSCHSFRYHATCHKTQTLQHMAKLSQSHWKATSFLLSLSCLVQKNWTCTAKEEVRSFLLLVQLYYTIHCKDSVLYEQHNHKYRLHDFEVY